MEKIPPLSADSEALAALRRVYVGLHLRGLECDAMCDGSLPVDLPKPIETFIGVANIFMWGVDIPWDSVEALLRARRVYRLTVTTPPLMTRWTFQADTGRHRVSVSVEVNLETWRSPEFRDAVDALVPVCTSLTVTIC